MNKQETNTKLHKTLTVVGIILCVILIPVLIINCTLLVKSYVNEEEVPDFGGILPFIVLTDSMAPEIDAGDLIICKTIDSEDVELGDVISFFDPAGNGTSVATHKVVEIVVTDGVRSFRTKGVNNNIEDRMLVPADNVIARYTGFRIPYAGHVAIFMQTTTGLLICVVLPIILFVGYDVIRRRIYDKKKGDDMAALMAELEALKAQTAQKPQAPEAEPEVPEAEAQPPEPAPSAEAPQE